LPEGIALGISLAQSLNVAVGDKIRVITPNGPQTPRGRKPRVSSYEVVYTFRSGQLAIDATRAYLPLAEAQPFLNRDEVVDQIEVMIQNPQQVTDMQVPVLQAAGERAYVWTWRDRSGGFLRALQLQDNALYVLLGILLLIATMNIISGLIMLVKNKGRDIGILRTMGLTQGSVLRVFFIVGASIGVMGTLAGVILGILFTANIEHVYGMMDVVTGNSRNALEAQGFFYPPAVLQFGDLMLAICLSLGLSFVITWFPARRAARMSPVEALRYE